MARKTIKPFRFKKFEVSHTASAHKVGVDGVLVGLWSPLPDDEFPTVLDIGCGSGVISLIIAQRLSKYHKDFKITGIDIDELSVEEAEFNFHNSPWSLNIKAEKTSLSDFKTNFRYSLIISNPPYFKAGIDIPESRRLQARHIGLLSPEEIIRRSKDLLADKGKISIIVPSDQTDSLIEIGKGSGLATEKICFVRGHSSAPVKRALINYRKGIADIIRPEITELILESQPGVPTEDYRSLGKDFYLYF